MDVGYGQPKVMRYNDVIPGDVEPISTSHVPPSLLCIAYSRGTSKSSIRKDRCRHLLRSVVEVIQKEWKSGRIKNSQC
jgi:hypothetical protein